MERKILTTLPLVEKTIWSVKYKNLLNRIKKQVMLRRQQKRQEQCKSLRLAHTTDNILTQDYSVKGRVFRDLQNKRPIDRFSYVVKWFEMGKQELNMAAQVRASDDIFIEEIASSLAKISIFTDKSAL